ncbi:MAG: hypothetical protein R6W90_15770 [Ignavibacteriaceae bacterium]
MKTKFIIGFALIIFLSGSKILLAQSDYETVQNFKKEVNQIEQSIRDADSLGAIDGINSEIDQLRDDYSANKELLDNSLYPNTFDKTIESLRNAGNLRRKDFAQIDVLETKVSGLEEQVDTLKSRNDELAMQFNQLESQTSARIAGLEKAVAQLRASLQKRDQIVMNMLSDLLPSNYTEGEELSPEEKQEILTETEKNNILFNIKKAVSDNIRFLDATRLYPADLRNVKAQKDNFARIWKNAGPTLVEVYAGRGKSTAEFEEIDEAFASWDAKIHEEVWSSINTEFAENNIRLKQFSSGKEFTSTIVSYIGDEIMNISARDNAEAEFNNFDSTWSNEIEPAWLPFLLDNQMISEAQEDSMEVMIASWEDAVYPEGFNWLYVIIGVLAVAVVVLLFTRKSPKPHQEPYQNS